MRNIAREGVSDGRGNNCIYSWAFDRKMGKSVTVSEVKFVTAHEVINNINYNNQSHTDMSNINPVNQSEDECAGDGKNLPEYNAINVIDGANTYMGLIRDHLEYDHHMKYDECNDREIFEEIYEIICDIVCVKHSVVRINGEDYPYELVKSRFLKLNSGHVEYVMDCMRRTTTKITNIKSYLITALYNAPSTMSHYYQQEVQHDLYGSGWAEHGEGEVQEMLSKDI